MTQARPDPAEGAKPFAMQSSGHSAPLGATVSAGGVNFSVYSRDATGVDLLLFDAAEDPKPSHIVSLDPANHTYHYWHMVNEDIISMPDKWEYPWYAAWDLAFHTLPLSIVDPDFAKQQMNLMLHGLYLHPNGQVPAYEWNFSDVNPPVHAFATIFLHRTEQALRGDVDMTSDKE